MIGMTVGIMWLQGLIKILAKSPEFPSSPMNEEALPEGSVERDPNHKMLSKILCRYATEHKALSAHRTDSRHWHGLLFKLQRDKLPGPCFFFFKLVSALQV